MVVVLPTEPERVDRIFHALADPTRRDIVARALAGEHSVSALARHYPMSVTAVQKHVAVLVRAGLAAKEPRGREQIVRADRAALRCAHEALDELEQVWRHRVSRMGEVLTTTDEGEPR